MKNTASFTSGDLAFTVVGLKLERNTYEVGAGVGLANNQIWSLEGVYSYL